MLLFNLSADIDRFGDDLKPGNYSKMVGTTFVSSVEHSRWYNLVQSPPLLSFSHFGRPPELWGDMRALSRNLYGVKSVSQGFHRHRDGVVKKS
ncbi:hypothetical protein MRB53_024400 [Persea americana]|uniref:Uncharacterized protein n=1 Tax=Persea americana TaxID=3435 RepID=A0ACC2LC40_PERAE|nr:hypothetical protein MRB53_024400 [Persea americana]